MRFRQIEQLFNARPEPDAKQFASAKSNERMRELIASPEGISPGVHEAKNTVPAIGRGNDHHRKSNEQHHDQHRKQSGPHSAQEQNTHGDRDDHHEGPEVRLLEQQHAHHHHRPGHGQEGFFQIVHVRHLAHRVIRRIEHNKKFHHFGRLQAHWPNRKPAASPIHIAPDPGHEDKHKHHAAGHEQPRRHRLPARQGHLEGHSGSNQPDGKKNGMPQQVVRRIVSGHATRFGNRDRRRVDHHHADQEQKEPAPQQSQIDLGWEPARHVQTGHHQPRSSCSSRTAATKTSARWL